jgi:hypothetical protein
LGNAKSQLQKRIIDDQLAEITDNKSVNIVMEKLGEVRDENDYLKRKMEFLEGQLQGRKSGELKDLITLIPFMQKIIKLV